MSKEGVMVRLLLSARVWSIEVSSWCWSIMDDEGSAKVDERVVKRAAAREAALMERIFAGRGRSTLLRRTLG